MSTPCARCGRPLADGAVICRAEAADLAAQLALAAGHAEDAEAVLTRQTRYGSGAGGGNGEDPLPGDLTASAKLQPIVTAICGWARVVVEETGRRPRWRVMAGPLCPPQGRPCAHDSCGAIRRRQPPGPIARDAAWLARQTEWLRRHPAAGEAFADLERACDALARLVDRPPDKELVGVCDCGKVLYAPDWRQVIQCPVKTCQLVWNVDESRDILRRHLGDKLVTAAEAAHLAAFWDERTSRQISALIAAWARRALLTSHGFVQRDPTEAEIRAATENGETAGPVSMPLYRFGDVADRLARTPRRNREGAAA